MQVQASLGPYVHAWESLATTDKYTASNTHQDKLECSWCRCLHLFDDITDDIYKMVVTVAGKVYLFCIANLFTCLLHWYRITWVYASSVHNSGMLYGRCVVSVWHVFKQRVLHMYVYCHSCPKAPFDAHYFQLYLLHAKMLIRSVRRSKLRMTLIYSNAQTGTIQI